MAKSDHAHVYGCERVVTLALNGSTYNNDKYACMECGHKPSHKMIRSLRNRGDIPMDVSRFVINRYSQGFAFGNIHVSSAQFAKIQQQRLTKKD